MATKNFTQFTTASPLTTGDYIVGYKEDGSQELKTTVKQIVDLVQDSDSQTLSFNNTTKDLSITSGNTVSLLSLVDSSVDTAVRGLTGVWQDTSTIVQTNSSNWSNNSTFNSISANDITLTNAELSAGTTLVESVSSLIITINNQVYRVPLLPV